MGYYRSSYLLHPLSCRSNKKFFSCAPSNQEIANAAGGKYHYIPKAGEGQIAAVASAAVADAKS